MKKKTGFTLIEVLVVLAVISGLFGYVFNIMNRSFKFGQIEVKTLDALQEMTLIVNYLRKDVKTLVEDTRDPETYIKFDSAKKSLEFTVVSGIAENGFPILSRMRYFFDEERNFCKYSFVYDKKNGMRTVVKKLAAAGHIEKFEAEAVDRYGYAVASPRKAGKHPEMIRIKLNNSANKRLDTELNIYLTYMKDYDDLLDMSRLPGWKTKTIEQERVMVKMSGGNFLVELTQLDQKTYYLLFHLMKLSNDMNTPIFFQKSIVDIGKPFRGARLGNSNPYADPPPAVTGGVPGGGTGGSGWAPDGDGIPD